jgi:hypothetical protein
MSCAHPFVETLGHVEALTKSRDAMTATAVAADAVRHAARELSRRFTLNIVIFNLAPFCSLSN